jgi:hypothetical protein
MPGTDNAPTAADTLRWPSGASWHLGLAGDLCGPGREEGLKDCSKTSAFRHQSMPKTVPKGTCRAPRFAFKPGLVGRVLSLNHLSHVMQLATNQINLECQNLPPTNST